MAEAKTPYLNTAKKVVLQKAPFKFPALDKPDTSKFSLGKCTNGVFKTTVLYKADSPFVAKLTAELDALYEKGVAEVAKLAASMPTTTAKDKQAKKAFETIYPKNDYFKIDTGKDGEETGYVAIQVKLNATQKSGKPNTFVLIDAAKNPLPRNTPMWGGTEGIIQANAKFYNLAGPKQSGISLELLGVQIINLVGPGGGERVTASADDFDVQDGYVSDGEDVPSTPTPTQGGSAEEDEEVPF